MFLDYLFRTREKNALVAVKDYPWMMGLKVMPAPSVDYYERAFVYIGTTDATFTNGYVYLCTRSGSEGAYTYAWTCITTDANRTPSDENPLMNGTAAPGTNAAYSRKDHVHPSDTSRATQAQFVEKTGYGILSGLVVAQQTSPDMTFKVSAGVRYKADGTRQAVAAVTSQAVDAADTVKNRVDLVYVDDDGVVQYLPGIITVDAVAGVRSYTVAVNAVEGDTVVIDGETFTAIRTTPSTDEFNIGNTLALTATAIYTVLGLNANITGKFDVTNPSDGVIVLTEKVAGGGDTPAECSVDGDAVISNGSPTTSAAAVAGARDYVVTDRAELADTFAVAGETMTCVNGTPGTDEFAEAGTIAATVTNLAAALAANTNIDAKYAVTTPSANTIRLTEKTPGGGDTPGASSTTGTLAVTDGTATTSAAAVAGARTYTLTGQAAHKDVIGFEAEEFTALKAAAGTDEFVPGATAALTATALYNLVNANTALSALHTATNPEAGVFTLTEKSAGGGDTPGEASVTGTIEITNGSPTASVVPVSGGSVPATPEGGAAIAEIAVIANQASVTTSDITKKRVWTSPGIND